MTVGTNTHTQKEASSFFACFHCLSSLAEERLLRSRGQPQAAALAQGNAARALGSPAIQLEVRSWHRAQPHDRSAMPQGHHSDKLTQLKSSTFQINEHKRVNLLFSGSEGNNCLHFKEM